MKFMTDVMLHVKALLVRIMAALLPTNKMHDCLLVINQTIDQVVSSAVSSLPTVTSGTHYSPSDTDLYI